VYGVFSDKVPKKDLPWAEYRLPLGARANDGTFCPVKKGDYVWVDFPYQGDTRRPRITGSVHFAPDGVPNLPHEAFAGPDVFEHKRAGEESAPADHAYGEDEVSSQHGVTLERNKDGSVSIYQRTSGSEICIDKDGNVIIHGEKGILLSSAESAKGVVAEDFKITVQGAAKIIAMGKIALDGGSADTAGAVTGACICAFTGAPHPDFSKEIELSKGG
jgi:hypothetical protein